MTSKLDATKLLTAYLASQCALALTLSLACVFLVTLTYDEAWLLESISRLLEEGRYAPLHSVAPLTTGGAYALVQLGVAALFGPSVVAARLSMFAAFLLLCGLVSRLASRDLGSPSQTWIVLGTLLGAPGALLFGGLAYGSVLATLLVIAAVACFDSLRAGSWTRRLATGVLLGLAGSTRINALLVFPAWVLWLLIRKDRRQLIVDSLFALAIGTLLWAVLFFGLVSFADPHSSGASPAAGLRAALFAPGRLVSAWPGAFKWFTTFIIAVGWISPVTMLATSAAWLHLRQSGAFPHRSWGVVLCFAWLNWLFFCSIAAIPHQRYLLPSLLGVFLVLGYCLARYFAWAVSNQLGSVARCILGVACVAVTASNVVTLADLADGNGNRRLLEQLRWDPQSHPRLFAFARDQRRLKEHLREVVPPGETVAAALELATELRFETRRPVLSARYLEEHAMAPPRVFVYRSREQLAEEWGGESPAPEQELRETARFGDFAVFVRDAPP